MQAQYGPVVVPAGPADDRFVFLSDVLPTAWQAVEYAAVPEGGTLAVIGLGPIGDMAARIGLRRGYRVIGIDLVPERLSRAQSRGVEILGYSDQVAHKLVGLLPNGVAEKMMETVGVDRLAAFYLAIELVRRGGTISLSGVYGGAADPLPMLTMFDKQIQLRMGQGNVRRWVDDILPLLTRRGSPRSR